MDMCIISTRNDMHFHEVYDVPQFPQSTIHNITYEINS